MIRDLLKWVAPGLATVLCGTSLALAMTSGEVVEDLSIRSAAALQNAGADWAELSFDMRDLQLTGTTANQADLDLAIAELSALPGVRSLASDVTLAPLAKPYQFQAKVADGKLLLSGAVPDQATRSFLEARAGVSESALVLHSGMPDRQTWLAAAEFAVDAARSMDQGEGVVSDLAVTLDGRAASERAFRELTTTVRAGAPVGATLETANIQPALVAPYQWSAVSDGIQISVSGFVPNDTVGERIRTADAGGKPIATGLALGSGEPVGFAELSEQLVQQLGLLEKGEAHIIGSRATLTGTPATLHIAQTVAQNLQDTPTIVTLDAPRIADYWVSATKQPGGVTVFDGYAPDEATKTAIGQRQGADINYLKLGRGAPDRYQAAVDFGLDALELMSEGRFSLRGAVVTLSGVARSGGDYQTLLDRLGTDAPQGITVERGDLQAPRANQFVWSVSKTRDGAVTLDGMLPNLQAKATLVASAGGSAQVNTSYASGEPTDFIASAETAIGLLDWLAEGKIAYDGSGWTVTGTPATAIDKAAIETDFMTRQLAGRGWSMAISAPQATTVAAAPEVEVAPVTEPVSPPEPAVDVAAAPVTAVQEAPSEADSNSQQASVTVDPSYAFSADRAEDGSVLLSGQLPTDETIGYFSTITSGDTAAVSIANGAPPTFLATAEAGLRALMRLQSGQLNFANGKWTLAGLAPDQVTLDAVLAAIPADTLVANITLPEPEPEPVVAAVAPAPDAAPADISACATPLAEFSARNAILFQSGAAIIATESQAALDELSTDLAACPDAVVHVEGHTDADGDESLNLALSVARAEAVVAALVERGITPARLYAVGYGESSPIADNDTPDGKRLNRRIVVTVLDQHF